MCAVCLPAAAFADAKLVIVTSAESPALDELDHGTLRRVYLGRQTRVRGRRVRCAALPAGSPERNRFNGWVLRLDEDALTDHWIEQALLGGALPPQEFETPEDLARHLRDHPGRVGYLLHDAGYALPAGLKQVKLRR